MAFGIDDALASGAAAIKLTTTLVEVVQRYGKKGIKDVDIERLIEDVRLDAIDKIDCADVALRDLERLLVQKKANLDLDLDSLIRETDFWNLFERGKLRRIRKSLNDMGDAIYDASDDIAALVKCKEVTGAFGEAIVESLPRKHLFQDELHKAGSVKQMIVLMRTELMHQKKRLQGGV